MTLFQACQAHFRRVFGTFSVQFGKKHDRQICKIADVTICPSRLFLFGTRLRRSEYTSPVPPLNHFGTKPGYRRDGATGSNRNAFNMKTNGSAREQKVVRGMWTTSRRKREKYGYSEKTKREREQTREKSTAVRKRWCISLNQTKSQRIEANANSGE